VAEFGLGSVLNSEEGKLIGDKKNYFWVCNFIYPPGLRNMKNTTWLLSFFVLLLFSACTTQKTFQNSGALNTISIELADDNVSYERLNAEFDRETFGGFLIGASSQNVVEANIITNNNGEQQASAVGAFGANILAGLSLVSTAGALYTVLEPELNGEVERDFNVAAALVALGFGFILNEAIWRPFNRQRISAEAVRNAMQMNPDADFYSFPYSELELRPELFGTKWKGNYRIVAGNVSDRLFVSNENSNTLPISEDEEPIQLSKTDPRIDSNPEVEAVRPESSEMEWPIINGKVIKLGSTGTYAASKKSTAAFTVVNFINYVNGDEDFIIVTNLNYGDRQEQKKFKSTNPKLSFD
jgi:hypothetical protein